MLTIHVDNVYTSVMARKKIPISFAISPELLAAVNKWIDDQDVRTYRTWVFETALSEFLEKRKPPVDDEK